MKKIKFLLVVVFSVFMFMPNVNAVTIDDLVTADSNNISSVKEIDGTSFTFGNSIELKNKINGISFVAGNTIKNSSSSDYAFIAGNNINLDNISAKDIFVAGNVITVNSDSIERDVYIAGSDITVNGEIGRNLYVTGDNITINATIGGNLTLAGSDIKIGDNTSVSELFKYNDDAKIDISKSANINKVDAYESDDVDEDDDSLVSTLFSRIKLYVNILLLSIILLYLFKGFFKATLKEDINASSIIKNLAIGFATLIFVPIILLLLLISYMGVSISLISLMLYIAIIYLSSIFTVYYFTKKLLDKKIENDYLKLTIGLLFMYLVRFIPFVGGIITAFSLFFGIGLAVITSIRIIKERK